jgi:hypothetical protein
MDQAADQDFKKAIELSARLKPFIEKEAAEIREKRAAAQKPLR